MPAPAKPDGIPSLAKINFICSGVGALIGWNSILTALDFFGSKYPFNVSFLFGIPLFISTNIFSYMIYIIAKYLSLNSRILGGLIIMCFVLIFMPIIADVSPNENGFYVSLVLIFIQGMANSIMQGSAVSFAAIFPFECLSYYFTGTGIAGMTICILRMIMLGIFGSEEEYGIMVGTIVYFTISASFLMINLVLYILFKKTDFCKYYIQLAKSHKKPNQTLELPESSGKEALLNGEKSNSFEEKDDNLEISREVYNHDWKFILKVFWKINPLPLVVFLIYVQTFMMFPGVSLKKEMSGISKAWNSTLLIFVFNLFDTVGKYISANRNWYSRKSTYILVFLRFIFYIFYLIMASRNDIFIICDDWFAIVNMALFSLLNGYTTSCAMVLAPELVENDEKETVGFLMTHPLYLGIMIGTFLALPFEAL